ncbi:hypothetical protein CEXT_482211 [Caerostris extrusa]|uniref:Uncharacterized protein n=1 Tax=Caerostris extrusa TaxID=172846 RepID=A0AAV4W460_CAEEX|nr:hypothetical protein CEXT_482211 [Caerostris extrusa]
MPRTFLNLLPHVHFGVSPHRIAPFEALFRTCRMFLEAFLRSNPIVSNQVVRAGEGPRAYCALEGLLPSVHLQMATEIAVAKNLLAQPSMGQA